MKIQPLGDRVLVEPVESPDLFEGTSLLKPETAKERPNEGVIVAASFEAAIMPAVKVGARILYHKYSGNDVVADGRELLIMRVDEILAVVEYTPEELAAQEEAKHKAKAERSGLVLTT